MSSDLPPGLLMRLKERAADASRRTDAASLVASAVPLDQVLAQLGSSTRQLQRAAKLLGGLSGMMTSVAVVGPGVHRTSEEREQLPAPASEAEFIAAEADLGISIPQALRQIYSEVADGGFGPGGGLFSLARAVREYSDLRREPVGPQKQSWPELLLPLVDAEPGYDCLDLATGEVIAWDPEEIEGYSDAVWRRSFKEVAPSLAAWLESWLERPLPAWPRPQ